MQTLNITSVKDKILKYSVKSFSPGLKRVVLLSSLIAVLTETTKPELHFLENIDKALNVSKGGAKALEFPSLLAKVFWGKQELFRNEITVLNNEMSTDKEMQAAAQSVAKQVPDWFLYDAPKCIENDIVRYFKYCRNEEALLA